MTGCDPDARTLLAAPQPLPRRGPVLELGWDPRYASWRGDSVPGSADETGAVMYDAEGRDCRRRIGGERRAGRQICHAGHLAAGLTGPCQKAGHDIRHAEIRICRTGPGVAARIALGA